MGPRMALYSGTGRRRVLPPLLFGAGVLWHLLRDGKRYDAVHTCSFPYFSLLAVALMRPRWRYSVVVDWFELWTRGYWREYLGRLGGDVGWLVQRLCVRIPQRAFCFSRLHAARLRDEGLRGDLTMLAGAYTGPLDVPPVHDAEPLVVFAGRHIPEKRVPAIVPAIARARAQLPQLRAEILGDGPERPDVIRLVSELGLRDVVSVPGFLAGDAVEQAMDRALCVLLPSRREGYGLVVVEAAARGTPSVIVADPDNAAVELVVQGVNGFIAASAEPEDMAGAIVAVHQAGRALRDSTSAWFAANAERLSLQRSVQIAVEAYGAGRGSRPGSTPAAAASARRQPAAARARRRRAYRRPSPPS